MLGLIALAATLPLPAPDWYPALSLDSPTGRHIYIAGLILFAFGFFVLRGVENTAQVRKQTQRDKQEKERHEAAMALQKQHYESVIARQDEQHGEQIKFHERHSVEIAGISQQFSRYLAGAPISEEEREQLMDMFNYVVDQLDQVSKNYTLAADTLRDVTHLLGSPYGDVPSEGAIVEAREVLREWLGKRVQANQLLIDRAARLKLPGGGMVPPTLPSGPNTKGLPPKEPDK